MIGRGCLSQWWEGSFSENGIVYPSAEHYMMAGKARLFGDERTEARILAAGHPKEATGLGRQVKAFDEAAWVAQRFELVARGNVAKFGQDPALRAYLLGTGRRILVEASPLDRLWGIGLRAEDQRARRPSQWLGLNLLGFALMEARFRLSA
jgi:ribA/ribD-fused uncharacterized protein